MTVCTPQPPKKECAYKRVDCRKRRGHKGNKNKNVFFPQKPGSDAVIFLRLCQIDLSEND